MTTAAANEILDQLASQIVGLKSAAPSQPFGIRAQCDTAEDIASIIKQLGEFTGYAQEQLHIECEQSAGFGDKYDRHGHQEGIEELSSDLVYEIEYAIEEARKELPVAAE